MSGRLAGRLGHSALWLALSLAAVAASAAGPRPPITGISHIAVYAADARATERFYVHDLGATRGADPEDSRGTRYYFSASQFVEVLPPPAGVPAINRLDHVAFATPDAEAMRRYLAAAGVRVPDTVTSTREETWFEVRDPEYNRVRFVQARLTPAITLSPRRFSDHIIHVGFVVRDRAREDGFYRNILGFRPYWFGGNEDEGPSWISQQVPDGRDWLEYMVVAAPRTRAQLGIFNHFSLGVINMEAVYTRLWNEQRLAGQEGTPKIGRDAKWQLNLHDPDDTRAEIMELHAIGKPCCSPFTAPDP